MNVSLHECGHICGCDNVLRVFMEVVPESRAYIVDCLLLWVILSLFMGTCGCLFAGASLFVTLVL